MNTDSPQRAVIGLPPGRIAAFLAFVVVCLLLAHALTVYLRYVYDFDYAMGFIPRFYMNYEGSVPAYFSASLLLAAALLFYFIHSLFNTDGPRQRQWLVLALVFAFLAVDEATGLHELLIAPISAGLGTSGLFRYAWVIPYGIGVLLLGLYLLPHVWRLRPDIRFLFFAAGAVYVGGALGMEMLAGHAGLDGRSKSIAFEIVSTTEELLEMAGLILLIYAQLRLMRGNRDVAIRVL